MKRLIGVLLLVAAMCGAAWAQNLSARAFTEEIAKALRSAAPSARVTVEKDLEVRIRYAGGQDFTAVLTTAYSLYRQGSEPLDKLISLHVSKFSKPPTAQEVAEHASLDPARIIPVVKPLKWLEDLQRQIKAKGSQQEQLVESFSDDLVLAYAEDTSTIFRYITTHEYKGKREDLRALAVRNLARRAPKIEMRILNPYVSIISAGEDYTPSLLLLDDIWSGDQIKVKGEIVVAIPARDVILVTGSRSGKMTNFRAFASELYAKGPHSISQSLSVYRNGRFVKYGRN